jgi:Asparagine synthase (glutamine-hydrolyzing)
MANFLLVHDPDPVRRQFVALRARSQVAFLPQLRGELLLAPHYAVAWAAAESAPVDQHRSSQPDSTDCLLFGEPFDDSGRLLTAAEISRAHETVWDAPSERNGYYAALLVHPRLGVRVEADALGIFPLYYWQQGDILLVGSSPELFRCHPAFERAVDPHGVAALLLTSGLVGGRTLWRGVRRLGPDHLLVRPPGGSAREIAPPPLHPVDVPKNVDALVEHIASLHLSALQAGLKTSQQPGLLLSGGLDSRLLAGLVSDAGIRPDCLTFGRAHDLDAHCATLVARELQLPQTIWDVSPDDYSRFALSSVTWEQLSGGLYALPMGWNTSVRPPGVTMDRMVCGLTLDAVIGGAKYVATADRKLSFDALRIARLGYARRQLGELIAAPELARACDDIRDELVQEYLTADPADHLREWRMNLAHRQRFAVGACAWRYSLFAWPVLPALDRRLIRLAARLPHEITRKRGLQTRMLVTRFPHLARLDLDRNYLDTIPLIGTRRSLLFDLQRRARKLGRRALAWAGRDPRFYVRTMEFNSPGWRIVRALADEARGAATSLFRADRLAQVVPPSSVTVRRIQDPITESAPLKNTLGLMLWLRQHA